MTINNVLKAIERLENIKHTDEFAYEEAISALLSIGQIPVLFDLLPSNTNVYRSRTHSQNNLFFNKISDVFLPPEKIILNFGRCNRPVQSKLYMSESRPISYLELVNNWHNNFNIKNKLYVTLGHWITQKDFNLIIITTPEKNQRFSNFDKYYGECLDKFIKTHDKVTQTGFIAFYKYIYSKFTRESKNDIHTYIITTAYCNLALNLTKEKTNGILYSSTIAKEYGMNMAFNSNISTSSNFKLVTIIRNEISLLKADEKINFTETDIIKPKSFDQTLDKIIW